MAEWWTTFFAGNWLDVQRNVPAERTSAELAFLERALDLTPGCRILDVPSGTGRLALPLAERGYRMTGVDITEAVLQVALSTSQEAGLEVELLQADMRDLPWSETFDAAFCFWGSFGYFDDDGNRRFLEAVRRSLRTGSRFAIDTPNLAEHLLPRPQHRSWSKNGETLVLEDITYRYEESRAHTEWTLIANGESETKSTSIRVYGFRELTVLLSEVGFEVCETFSSLDYEPYELGRRAYFIVRKKQA